MLYSSNSVKYPVIEWQTLNSNQANAGKVHGLCDAVVSAKQRTEFQDCWNQAKLLNASSYAAAQKTFDSDAGKKGDTKVRIHYTSKYSTFF